MSREIILSRLRSVHGVKTDNDLLNILQGCAGDMSGIVSDGLESIEELGNEELMKAYKAAGLEAI